MATEFNKWRIAANSHDVYNMLDMSGGKGGKLNIPKPSYIIGCVGLKKNHARNSAKVFFNYGVVRAFFDVDHTGKSGINQICGAIASVGNDAVFALSVPLTVADCFVTKNESKENYHIYVNAICASMSTMREWCTRVNVRLGFDCIDTCLYSSRAHAGLRVDGFNKLSVKENRFMDNTAYYPVDRSGFGADFFERIWPSLEDGDKLTPLQAQFKAHDFNSVLINRPKVYYSFKFDN